MANTNDPLVTAIAEALNQKPDYIKEDAYEKAEICISLWNRGDEELAVRRIHEWIKTGVLRQDDLRHIIFEITNTPE